MPKLLKKQSLKTCSPAQRASLQRLNEGTQNRRTFLQPSLSLQKNLGSTGRIMHRMRAKERLSKHQNELQDIKSNTLPVLRRDLKDATSLVTVDQQENRCLRISIEGKTSKLLYLQKALAKCQAEKTALKKCIKRLEDAVQRAVGRTKAAMQKQGASQRLRSVGAALDVQVKERISKTQVARVIAEGGIIAEMQLGHAVATCKTS
ncbi:hypothetical protein CPB85DRAFT_1253162 [Mucidula mucida]|nr:hypothetical protein CPB85DRAFT_1253162 [Mucidula mucida]